MAGYFINLVEKNKNFERPKGFKTIEEKKNEEIKKQKEQKERESIEKIRKEEEAKKENLQNRICSEFDCLIDNYYESLEKEKREIELEKAFQFNDLYRKYLIENEEEIGLIRDVYIQLAKRDYLLDKVKKAMNDFSSVEIKKRISDKVYKLPEQERKYLNTKYDTTETLYDKITQITYIEYFLDMRYSLPRTQF